MTFVPAITDVTPGSRRGTVLAGAMHEIAERRPEALREWLETDEVESLWKAAFLKRLNDAERDAVRLYLEARRLVNTQTDVNVLVVNTVGASASDARAAVETVRRVGEASPEDIARAALDALDAYCAERGMTIEQARQSLAVVG